MTFYILTAVLKKFSDLYLRKSCNTTKCKNSATSKSLLFQISQKTELFSSNNIKMTMKVFIVHNVPIQMDVCDIIDKFII